MRTRPPRFATWLLAKRVAAPWREFVLGDLEEEFAKRSANSPWAADAWLWWQTVRCLAAPPPVRRKSRRIESVRGDSTMRTLIADFRYAGRTMRRSPWFTAFAIAIMALGIGANTAMFSVVSGVLLKPLPYPGADRIVTLRTAFLARGETQALVSIANFKDWRDHSSSFEAMSSYRPGESSVTPGDTAEYARIASVDAQFFRVFGVEPVIGRTFTPEEVSPDAPPYVLISHAYWQARFAGDGRILERTIRVNNRSRSIIGVLPAGFQFPGQTDMWLPQATRSTSRTGHNLFAVGRLKAEVSLEHAQADLTRVAAALEQQYPDNKERGVTAVRLRDDLVGDLRLTLYLLWGVVGMVLLIACANTATLLLGKAAARTREVAVRVALGASRRRIIRQLIAESLLLGLVAGVTGLLVAYWGANALLVLTPADVVRHAHIEIDLGVLAFTLVVSVVTSMLFGVVPALHASKFDLIDALRQGGARSVGGGSTIRTRGLLVVAEIALTVVLMTGAGLLTKSLIALHNVDLGFQPGNVLVMKATGVRSSQENNVFFEEILRRIGALPGIVAVGATSIPPGDLRYAGSGSHFVDHLPKQLNGRNEPLTFMSIIAPRTFAALGIPLRSGRDFDQGDTADRPLVAIVNEALVRKSFAGQNPLGRQIFCLFDRSDPMTIVGVVGDVRQRNPAMEPAAECYMPYPQHNYNSNTLNVVIRTVGDPLAMAPTVQRVAADVSREVPVSFTTMDATVTEGMEASRVRALLFGIFAGLAVCLAMAGVYGLIAYAVEQRSKEIALRIALGASKGSVLSLVLTRGFALAGAGLLVGLGASAAGTRLLETVLFEVRPFDILVYVAVAVLVVIVTLLASYLPAWRATVMNPCDLLKAE